MSVVGLFSQDDPLPPIGDVMRDAFIGRAIWLSRELLARSGQQERQRLRGHHGSPEGGSRYVSPLPP